MKPGWKSTEFWLTIAGTSLPLFNNIFGWHLDTTSILGMAGGIVGYILSRGYVKGSAAPSTESVTPSR